MGCDEHGVRGVDLTGRQCVGHRRPQPASDSGLLDGKARLEGFLQSCVGQQPPSNGRRPVGEGDQADAEICQGPDAFGHLRMDMQA
jgi:hypothetical protein